MLACYRFNFIVNNTEKQTKIALNGFGILNHSNFAKLKNVKNHVKFDSFTSYSIERSTPPFNLSGLIVHFPIFFDLVTAICKYVIVHYTDFAVIPYLT